MSTPRHKFLCQRSHAKFRGIPFLLSFEQWQKIWNDSGNWHLRGRGNGKYVMARHGDVGAYEVGNVSIVLNDENCKSNAGKKFSQDHRGKIGDANKNRVWTDSSRGRARVAAQRRMPGTRRSDKGQFESAR